MIFAIAKFTLSTSWSRHIMRHYSFSDFKNVSFDGCRSNMLRDDPYGGIWDAEDQLEGEEQPE